VEKEPGKSGEEGEDWEDEGRMMGLFRREMRRPAR